MIRAANLDDTLDFFVDKLGLVDAYRYDNDAGRFTLVFLSAPDDLEGAKARQAPLVEITYNWDPEAYDGGRNFGHYGVSGRRYLCDLPTRCWIAVTLNRPPRDGRMAFIRSPDGISIELPQSGDALPPQEPRAQSMENIGQAVTLTG